MLISENKLIVDTYLKSLLLNPEEQLVGEILVFIKDKINTINVIGLEDDISKLFCRSIESLDQDKDLSTELQELIIEAFVNIQFIANNTQKKSELMCIYLLNTLYSETETEFKEINKEDFFDLLDNLERIRVIFKIEKDKRLVFPIGRLLFKIIDTDNIDQEINNVSSIQALMLALQIFDSSKYSTEREKIMEMANGKNLRFLEYLFNRSRRIGECSWKENFKKNGLLILYDRVNNKVLIRNNSRSYFDNDSICREYSCTKPIAELNSQKKPIAYYVEYELQNWKPIQLKEILSQEDNEPQISQLLDLIYTKNFYNVIYQDALYEIDGEIFPINPFGCNDAFVVDRERGYENRIDQISKWLYDYGLLKVQGVGLRYINLGTIVKMEAIEPIPYSEFGINSDSLLGDVVCRWLEKCVDKHRCFDLFFEEYYTQIKYVLDRNELFEKEYGKEYIIPFSMPDKVLTYYENDVRFSTLPLETCFVENDLVQGTIIIKDSSQKILDGFSIEDIAGEELGERVIVEKSNDTKIALIDNKNKKIYVGNSVEVYYSIKEKIDGIRKALPSEEVIKQINERDVSDIAEKMNLFRKALDDIHPEIHIKSIARYRLIHHITLLELDKESIGEWLCLLNKHEIVDYSVVKGNSPLDEYDGVLYVPKDCSRSQSTLQYINEEYFKNSARRDPVFLYDPPIRFKGNSYHLGTSKISKIVFIFDLIQSGRSTCEMIDFYMDDSKPGERRSDCIKFRCGEKVISVCDIINSNDCSDFDIYSIYASNSGMEKVKKHVDKVYSKKTFNVLNPIKELPVSARADENDIDLMNKIYKNNLHGNMSVGKYMVIREYNMPKINIMSNSLLDIKRVVALFCFRPEAR